MFRSIYPHRRLAAAALLAASVSGCKNGIAIPVWNPFAKPTTGLAQTGENEYVQPSMPQPPETAASESSWTAPFKKFGDTISAPFKSADNGPAAKNYNDPIALAASNTEPKADLHVDLARLHEGAGKLSEAVGEYDKALDIDPKHLPALLGLARLYDRQARYDEALVFYGRAVKFAPDEAPVHNDHGLCLARSGNNKDAAAALRRAVAIEPKQILYRNNLATILIEMGRVDEAYQTLVTVHGEAVAHYNVGFLLSKQNRKSEALEHFQLAAQIDPNLKEAQQWVAALGGNVRVAELPKATPAPMHQPPAESTTTPANPQQGALPATNNAGQAERNAAAHVKSEPAKPVAVTQTTPAATRDPDVVRTASVVGDRYPVTSPTAPRAAAPAPAPAPTRPPLPEQISNLDVAPSTKPTATPTLTAAATTAARTDAPRYPASPY